MPWKSHLRKRQSAIANRSKRALLKSTPRIVARPIAMTRSLDGTGSWLGALSGWDTAARCELALGARFRRLLRIRLLAVLDEDLVDLAHERVHELALGIRADDLALAEERALPHSAGDADV